MQVRSMIWKFDRNKKENEWEFKAGSLQEAEKAKKNSLRGWYSIYTFRAEEPVNEEELKWSIRKDETLALVLFDIGAYREKELNELALKNMDVVLSFFTEQEKDILFRPVYDREGKGLENEPDSFEQVLRHLSQIGQVIRQGNYRLYVFQGMLVGSWGEMHTSAFLSKEHLQKMKALLMPCLGRDSFLAVRTPAQLRMLEEEGTVQGRQGAADRGKGCRLSLFDDAIFGSTTHLGTFGTVTRAGSGWEGSWTRAEELGFVHQIAETAPVGGEAVAPQEEEKERTDLLQREDLYVEKVLSELRKMQVTYLNSAHDLKLLEQWKKIPVQREGNWQGKSLYDFVGAHMGYCLLAGKVQMETAGRKRIRLQVEIENIGFANVYRDTEVCILLADKEKKIWEHSFQVKAGAWKPGEVRLFELREKAEAGRIFACIRLCGQRTTFLELANKNFGEQKKDTLLLGCLYRKEKV